MKEAFSSGKKQISGSRPKGESKSEKGSSPKPIPVEAFPAVSSVEETSDFLSYLNKYGIPESAVDSEVTGKRKSGSSEIIPGLNLKDGMPIVADALDRMRMGMQEMR